MAIPLLQILSQDFSELNEQPGSISTIDSTEYSQKRCSRKNPFVQLLSRVKQAKYICYFHGSQKGKQSARTRILLVLCKLENSHLMQLFIS